MGVELPPNFDLDAIDPYAPTDEQLAILTGNHDIKTSYLRANPAKLEQEIAILKARQAIVSHPPEDIPEPDIHRTEGDAELDSVLANIDVLAAYNKWIGKSTPDPRGKTKNIMISCPNPDHADRNPSASIDLSKGDGGLWVCHGTCQGTSQEGGDKYDLAAIGLGFPYPGGYKTDGSFPELRRQMARDFGYIVKRERGRTVVQELEVVTEREPDDPGDTPHDGPGDDDDPTPDGGGDGGGVDVDPTGDLEQDQPIGPVDAGADQELGPVPADAGEGSLHDDEGDHRDVHSDAAPDTEAPTDSGDPDRDNDGDDPGRTGEVQLPDQPQDQDDRPNPLRLVVPDPFDIPPEPAEPVLPELPEAPPSINEQVVPLRPDPDKLVGEFDVHSARLDWQKIIPKDTFLWEYMVQNCRFDIPHEFHLWLAFQLIAFACGYHIRLQDVPPISANLYTVLVAPTGVGKSRSAGSMKTLLNMVMPWTGTADMPGTGVKVMGGVESGQALIRAIGHEYEDPASSVPGTMISQVGVRGWTMPEEFAGFVKKAMRSGSDFKERAIEFYDVGKDGVVSTTSIKAGGEIKAQGPFLQITSTTQPEAIHTYLAAEDAVSGFLNRFVFVSGPSRDVRPARWLPLDAPDLARAADGLRRIVEFCETNDGLEMPYTEDGSAAWERLFILVEKSKHITGPMSVRLDLYLKKLMLIFAINEHKTAIDADIVNRMEPIMQHMLACYSRITGELYWRADDDCQNAILKYVHKKNESGAYPRRKEIVDAIKKPIQGRSRFDIMRALDVLDKLEMLSVVKVKNKTGPERQGYKITDTGTAVAARTS